MKFPYSIIDLTHSLSSSSPSWEGACGFQHQTILDYEDSGISFRVQKITMDAGIGTHIDAPAHCVKGGKTVAELDLNDLLSPWVMIDVSEVASESYQVSVEDIVNFESKYGQITSHSFVIIRTGWEKYWRQPDKYRNNYLFPCLAQEAAELLLQRKVVGIGIDTLSPDRPETGYPVHQLFLVAGKYIVENIANAANLPPVGSYILILPIKIEMGTEAPVRLIALMSRE